MQLSGEGWLAGGEFSGADSYALIFFRWGKRIGMDMGRFAQWAALNERTARARSGAADARARGLEGGATSEPDRELGMRKACGGPDRCFVDGRSGRGATRSDARRPRRAGDRRRLRRSLDREEAKPCDRGGRHGRPFGRGAADGRQRQRAFSTSPWPRPRPRPPGAFRPRRCSKARAGRPGSNAHRTSSSYPAECRCSAPAEARIGAVGVSGEAPADDAACAEAGVKAAGLRTARP